MDKDTLQSIVIVVGLLIVGAIVIGMFYFQDTDKIVAVQPPSEVDISEIVLVWIPVIDSGSPKLKHEIYPVTETLAANIKRAKLLETNQAYDAMIIHR